MSYPGTPCPLGRARYRVRGFERVNRQAVSVSMTEIREPPAGTSLDKMASRSETPGSG